jgi:hypothetical protein
MPEDLSALEATRTGVLRQISQLGDFRPGSINLAFRRCGKPSCHCSNPKDPGHGPNFLLTYKVEGKTMSEVLPDAAAVKKAQQEIAEFRRFEQLGQTLIEVSQKICRLRPMESRQGHWTAEEKKRLLQSIRRLRGK